MRMYGVAAWCFWVVGAVAAVGWLVAGAPVLAISCALSGAAAGIVFFGLGEVIEHLRAVRQCAERLSPEPRLAPETSVASIDVTVERTLEERTRDLDRLLDDAKARKR